MTTTPTESTFDLATIQRLQALGYRYQHGSAIDRALHAVVLEGPLRDYLRRRYAHLPASRKVPSQRAGSIQRPMASLSSWRCWRLLRSAPQIRRSVAPRREPVLALSTAMSANSAIAGTESTWNPLAGCTKISPGRQSSYAERTAKRLPAHWHTLQMLTKRSECLLALDGAIDY